MPLCLEYLYSQAHQGESASSSHSSEPPGSRTDEQVFRGGGMWPLQFTVFSCDRLFEYIHLVLPSSNHLTDAYGGSTIWSGILHCSPRVQKENVHPIQVLPQNPRPSFRHGAWHPSGQHSALAEQVDGGIHVSLSNCPLLMCGDSSLVTHTPTWWSLHTHSLR